MDIADVFLSLTGEGARNNLADFGTHPYYDSCTEPICVQPLGVDISECFSSGFISLLLSVEYNNLSKVAGRLVRLRQR